MREAYGSNDDRLGAIRAIYESTNLFRSNQNIRWTKPVELETMLRQQLELGALADAAQLVVKTAAVQRVADWSVATRQQASAFPRSMVTIAPDGLTLSRGVPLPAL